MSEIPPNEPVKLDQESLDFINNLPDAKGFVDCHNHVYAEEFEQDLEQTIEKALANQVLAMIVVAEGHQNFQSILQLQEKYPNFIFPCLGWHPIQGEYTRPLEAASLRQEYFGEGDTKFEEIRTAAANQQIVGIGEAGLDFTPKFLKNGKIDKETQLECLEKQFSLAKSLNLPINLHSRSAGRPLLEIMNEKYHNHPCQFHAFSGKASRIPYYINEQRNSNLFFSVGTGRLDLTPEVIKKKNSTRYKPNENFKFISSIPIRNLLLETDLPALGPERGVRNEPENLILAAQAVASVFNLPLEKVRNLTSYNACRLYPKLKEFFLKTTA